MSKIEFRIDKHGEVNLEISGVTGAKCQELTKPFEDALGIKVDSQNKPEFFVELEGMEVHVSESN